MSVYNKNGESLNSVFNRVGSSLAQAYDVNGNSLLSGGTTLKVATYNVGGWYIGSGTNVPTDKKTEYVNLQQSILSAVGADIVCFQEYWNQFCADGTTADSVIGEFFAYQQKRDANSTWNGHVIASKSLPITDYSIYNFVNATGAAPGYEKGYITVGGHRICILNTHLCTTAAGKKPEQSQEVFEALANEEYFVCMGDYNVLIDQYDTVIKQYIDAGYNSAQWTERFGMFYTYYATASVDGTKGVTDQIFTSPNIEITNVYVNTIKLTDGLNEKIDHIPLIVELVIH